jgi:xanthine dehydrogenase YagT iron-sulfur-binding subunit
LKQQSPDLDAASRAAGCRFRICLAARHLPPGRPMPRSMLMTSYASPVPPGTERRAPAGGIPITLTINGRRLEMAVQPWTTLLDLLREEMQLTGTKKGCDHGQCGACTVLLDGQRINSCLALAVTKDGAEVTTIEGLAGADGTLHPLQEAFVEHDAFQCGYCTPGQICSAVGLLREGHAHDAAEVREQMSGNICRCGAYPNIVAAIEQVRQDGGSV